MHDGQLYVGIVRIMIHLFFLVWKRLDMMECFYDNHMNTTSTIRTSRNQILRRKDKIPQLHPNFRQKSSWKDKTPQPPETMSWSLVSMDLLNIVYPTCFLVYSQNMTCGRVSQIWPFQKNRMRMVRWFNMWQSTPHRTTRCTHSSLFYELVEIWTSYDFVLTVITLRARGLRVPISRKTRTVRTLVGPACHSIVGTGSLARPRVRVTFSETPWMGTATGRQAQVAILSQILDTGW